MSMHNQKKIEKASEVIDRPDRGEDRDSLGQGSTSGGALAPTIDYEQERITRVPSVTKPKSINSIMRTVQGWIGS